MSQNRKTEVITFRMDPETYACLNEIARRLFNGVKAKAIRECLAIGMCALCSRQNCPRRKAVIEPLSRKIELDIGTAKLKISIQVMPKVVEKPLYRWEDDEAENTNP